MPALRSLLVLIVTAGVTLFAPPAWSAACRVTTTPLTFGVYDIFLMTAKTATAQVTVICNNKEINPATVQLTLSAGTSGNFAQRAMPGSSGGAALLYNIYTNAGLSEILGNGSGGSIAPTNQVDKTLTWIITLYGSIPPQQSVLVGTYSDNLIATILY